MAGRDSKANAWRSSGRRAVAALVCLASLAAAAAAAPAAGVVNDYPTVARADYVFACMASNGQTRRALEQCSCSIDVIASIIPYDTYVEAETVLRMRQIGGEKSSLFITSAPMKQVVGDLRRAQAEAEIRCF